MPRPDFGASGAQARPVASPPSLRSAGRTPAGRRIASRGLSSRWVAGLAVVAAITGVLAFHSAKGGASTAAAAGAGSFLTASPVAAPHVACLDHSASMSDYGQISKRALSSIKAEAAAADPVTARTTQDGPVSPTAGLDIWLRVIQANSYTTSLGDASTLSVQVPSTQGLRAGIPGATDSNYTSDASIWQADYSKVSQARSDAASDARAELGKVNQLADIDSHGSDISGCVASLLQVDAHGAAPSVLVVSDLADTLPRPLAGRFGSGRLTIVQACPSGRPAICQKRLHIFFGRMTNLGLQPGHVQVYRPEDVESAVHSWLTS